MAKTPGEFETEFIQTAKEKTGKSLEDWLQVVKASGLGKPNEILDWLKKTHELNHMQAQFVSGIFLNNGQPVYGNESALLDNQFAKCPEIRPLFEALADRLVNDYPGTQLIAKKTYVSFTSAREFAAINVKPGEIRLGLDLGDEPFEDIIQKTKLSGPMPRISHMIVVKSEDEFDAKVKTFVQQSYDRVHKK